jgi:cardiolipin synthase C
MKNAVRYKKATLSLALSFSLVSQSMNAQANGAKSHLDAQFSQYIDNTSSSGLMNTEKMQVIMDNQASFDQKLKIISSAKLGDELFLKYYIYSNDESTSVISEALIQAGLRGVKINLLIDYLTNYKRLDLFNAMTRLTRGALRVSFFNPPTSSIHKDIIYMTSNCLGATAAQCNEEKNKIVEKASADHQSKNHIGSGHIFSKLFLAGLSSKSPEAMKIAVQEGGTIPKMDSNSGLQPSSEEKKQLLEFAKILFGAKILGQTTDKIKLVLAMILHGEDVRPIYQAVDNALPLNTKKAQNAGKDWEEITQFTHHKLLALFKADQKSMQVLLGGRNLENSYHINEEHRVLTPKYLFADTDAYFEVNDKSSVKGMYDSVKQMADYSHMIATIDQINATLPVDYVMELDLLKKIIRDNPQRANETDFMSYAQQIENIFDTARKGLAQQREQQAYKDLLRQAKKYHSVRNTVPADQKISRLMPDFVEKLDARDTNAQIAYVENLTFREQTKIEKFKSFFTGNTILPRVYDPNPNRLEDSNKNIHAVWIEWFKNEALEAKQERKTRTLYINQGYVFLPSILVQLFSQMMDGTIDSEFIKIKVMTNSIQTTDLSPINVLARHQFKALYDYYIQFKGKPGSLQSLEMFEYNVMENGNKTSNHSKTIASQKNIFVGSANAEVRSYETDTNNGIFIKNAPHMARDISAHLEKLTTDPRVMTNVTKSFDRNHSQFLAEDTFIVAEIASKYKKLGERMKLYMTDISQIMIENMTDVYLMTGLLADQRNTESWLGKTSVIKNPEDSGFAGGANSKALICSKVFSSSSGPAYLNTNRDTIQRMQQIRTKHGSKLGALFDRIWQLI